MLDAIIFSSFSYHLKAGRSHLRNIIMSYIILWNVEYLSGAVISNILYTLELVSYLMSDVMLVTDIGQCLL